MSSLSEQISEISAELLLKAVGELGQVAYNAVDLGREVGKDAGALARDQLIKLINSVNDKKSEEARQKLDKAIRIDGEEPRQVTFLDCDREILENWLKKQNVLYAIFKSEDQKVAAGFEKSMLVFLEKDAAAVQVAMSLTQYANGYVNELPPQAMLFLNKKKNLSVVDGLDVYELEVFREVAKDFGLVYSAILNPPDANVNEQGVGDTYKIIASKKDAKKVAAVMQKVAWSMTGEYQEGIKEKIKERYSIKSEIQKLITKGIGPDKVFFTNSKGESVAVDNAKYIVNPNSHNQYLKLTKDGFVYFKYGKEFQKVMKNEPDYEDKLQFALGDFTDAVIFDVAEWENEGLSKENLRKHKVQQKLSVFPPEYDKKEEATKLQKARKHHQKEGDSETAWLFDRYDTQKAFSEVYEVNYGNLSEPPEKTVSVHYNDAANHSEKYNYIDVSNDEKTIDKIIESARVRSGEDTREQTVEKEMD